MAATMSGCTFPSTLYRLSRFKVLFHYPTIQSLRSVSLQLGVIFCYVSPQPLARVIRQTMDVRRGREGERDIWGEKEGERNGTLRYSQTCGHRSQLSYTRTHIPTNKRFSYTVNLCLTVRQLRTATATSGSTLTVTAT